MCQIFHHRWLSEALEEEKKCCHVFLRPSQTFWHSSQGANFIFRLCRDAIKETNRLMGRSVLLQGARRVQMQHTAYSEHPFPGALSLFIAWIYEK